MAKQHYDYSQMPHEKTKFSAGGKERFLKLKQTIGLQPAIAANQADINFDWLIELTRLNSNAVEEAIKADPNYLDFMTMTCEWYKSKNSGVFPRYDKDAVLAMIRIIDIVNSTNVWRMNRDAIINMRDFIVRKRNKFWEELENGSPRLVDRLTNASATPQAEAKSLSSKICKYFAEIILKKDDLYFINDSVIRRCLPFYLHYYLNEKNAINYYENASYEALFEALKRLQAEANKHISKKEKPLTKSELDHIIWYCYKSGDPKKI